MLLPHGYEGQGPEHSLQGWNAIYSCVPSIIFRFAFQQHRRRSSHVEKAGERPLRKPLIAITPKSLLRHKDAISTLEELADGSFQTVISKLARKSKRRKWTGDFMQWQGVLRPTGKASRGGNHRYCYCSIRAVVSVSSEDLEEALSQFPKMTEVVCVKKNP